MGQFKHSAATSFRTLPHPSGMPGWCVCRGTVQLYDSEFVGGGTSYCQCVDALVSVEHGDLEAPAGAVLEITGC
ncbi:hypothetical protein GCM10027449_08510 [Sinomonas notoginsengisoli]